MGFIQGVTHGVTWGRSAWSGVEVRLRLAGGFGENVAAAAVRAVCVAWSMEGDSNQELKHTIIRRIYVIKCFKLFLLTVFYFFVSS